MLLMLEVLTKSVDAKTKILTESFDNTASFRTTFCKYYLR